MVSSEQGTPKPVRAWAEYDEEATFSRLTDGNWDFVVTPKGASGEAAAGTTMSLMTAIRGRYIESPLRSLRVLFDTGHEMELTRRSSPVTVSMTPGTYTPLPPGCVLECLHDARGNTVFGTWFGPDTTDAEAVEQAIADAVRWIEEHE